MFSNIWLSIWSSDYDQPNVTDSGNALNPAPPSFKHTQEFYLGIYGALGFGQGKILIALRLYLRKLAMINV